MAMDFHTNIHKNMGNTNSTNARTHVDELHMKQFKQFNEDFANIKIKVATLERTYANLVKRVEGLEKTELLHSQPHDREETLM